MTKVENLIYPGKIILFGEYTVLFGGQAVAMPLGSFGSYWSYEDRIDEGLLSFLKYLIEHGTLTNYLDLEKLNSLIDEVKHKKVLKSNIPYGYGLGSSGSLCAAVYAETSKFPDLDMKNLRTVFIEMENFFHGESSGVDPLVSFLNKTVLIEKKEASITSFKKSPYNIYLLDSGISRSSKKHIDLFKDQISSGFLKNETIHELGELSESLINTLGSYQNDLLRQLSNLQLERLPFLIPDKIQQIWKTGQNQDVFLKLCGAGGGGMFLLFSKEILLEKKYAGFPIYEL